MRIGSDIDIRYPTLRGVCLVLMVGGTGTSAVTGVILLKLAGSGDGDEEKGGGGVIRDVAKDRDLLSRSVTHWSSLVRSISTPMMGDGYDIIFSSLRAI